MVVAPVDHADVLQLAAKYFFVRILAGTRHLASPTKVHWLTWLSCVTGAILVAYIIGSAIPIFGNLISLVGALIGPCKFTRILESGLWSISDPLPGIQRSLRTILEVCSGL